MGPSRRPHVGQASGGERDDWKSGGILSREELRIHTGG